jgi:putative membrane protein
MLFRHNKPHWQTEGKEPDYRFSLANERTFLAWTRTSLAVLAAASFFSQIDHYSNGGNISRYISIGLALIAAGISLLAYFRWKDCEIAMRHERPLNGHISLMFLALFVTVVAILLCAYIVRHSN